MTLSTANSEYQWGTLLTIRHERDSRKWEAVDPDSGELLGTVYFRTPGRYFEVVTNQGASAQRDSLGESFAFIIALAG